MDFKRTKSGRFFHRITEWVKGHRKLVIAFGVLVLIFIIAFGVTLQAGYRQLEAAFAHENEFVPTRLFSDVQRIDPPMGKAKLLKRLKALGYTPTAVEGNALQITLHPLDYPSDALLPPGDPTRELAGKNIRFVFDAEKKP
jgi:hypothetical protein